jgi:hypothetical protein
MNLEQITHVLEERVLGRFYGKYEGVVTAVDDPLHLGRLRAKVPAVLGEDVETGWAFPCAPFGGGRDHGLLLLPSVGDTVWMEFVGGEVSRPVWTGAFWGSPEGSGGQDDLGEGAGTEVPHSEGQPAGPGLFVLRTPAGHRLVLDDDGEMVILANGNDKAQIRLTRGGEVILTAEKILLGGSSAREPLVLGQAFLTLFNSHTHPTGVGPSGPPAPQLTPSQLSAKTHTE